VWQWRVLGAGSLGGQIRKKKRKGKKKWRAKKNLSTIDVLPKRHMRGSLMYKLYRLFLPFIVSV
jgi:hypothetical protein